MRRLLLITFLISVLIALVSCGKSAPSHERVLGATAEPDPLVPLGSPTELEGKWGSCRSSDGLGMETSLSFAGGAVRVESVIHQQKDCHSPLLRVRGTGTFRIGGALATPAETRAIDLSLDGIGITPLTSGVADALNADGACGYHGWSAGTIHDVTSSPCTTDGFTGMLDKQYAIFSHQGDRLFWGELGKKGSGTDGSDPSKRPVKLQTPPLQKK